EVNEALQLGVEEVLGTVGLDPDHLLDAGDADAGKADLRGRDSGLYVGCRGNGSGAAGHRSRSVSDGEVLPILRRAERDRYHPKGMGERGCSGADEHRTVGDV